MKGRLQRNQSNQGWFRLDVVGLPDFALLGIAVAALFHLQRKGEQINEARLLEAVGNPGFSPAAAAVMQLYRESKLFGEQSWLRGKNLMGANWQRVVLPEVDLEGADLRYTDLRDSFLENANLTKTEFHRANLAGANLTGTKLSGANFMEANLQRAILNGARASHASFFMARMQRVQMYGVNFEHSDFQEADLHGAGMARANLSYSLLRDTNFAEADLEGANLVNTRMMNANLTGANLSKADFYEHTVLPDAKWVRFGEDRKPIFDKYWTPETDMTRYTDPNHPDFWQPEWVQKYEWVKKNYEED